MDPMIQRPLLMMQWIMIMDVVLLVDVLVVVVVVVDDHHIGPLSILMDHQIPMMQLPPWRYRNDGGALHVVVGGDDDGRLD